MIDAERWDGWSWELVAEVNRVEKHRWTYPFYFKPVLRQIINAMPWTWSEITIIHNACNGAMAKGWPDAIACADAGREAE